MTVSAVSAYLPAPAEAMVDTATGEATQVWWYFFQRLFSRTGGGTGGATGPATPITVGASPFSFTAAANGSVIVSGGGVSAMEYSPDGSTTFYAAGGFYGAFPVLVGSVLRVTYVRAPVMTFVPG